MKSKLLKRIVAILIIAIAIIFGYKYLVEAKLIALPDNVKVNFTNRKNYLDEYLDQNNENALGDTLWAMLNTSADAGWNSLSSATRRKVILFTGISDFNAYCLDHSKYLEPREFTIKGYVKIVGDKAMGYRFVDNQVVKRPKDQEYIQDDANLVLARILHDGDYAKGWSTTGKRQLGLWRYMADTWMDKVGSSIIPSSFKHEYKRISSKETQSEWNNKQKIAKSTISEMSKDLQNYMPSEIINEGGTAEIENVNGEKIAGPFKVSYKGTIGGVHVLDLNENEIDSNNITILKDDKKTIIEDVKDIPSGENFYIKSTSTSTMGSILINMKKSTIITARLWFLRGSNTQDLLKVLTSEEKEDRVSLKIAIGINRGIIIEKVDSNDSNSKIEGAEFIVKDKEKGWIYEDTTEEGIIYKYAENSEQAKRYTTGKDGIVRIDNLPTGIYQIYETKAPYGYKISEQNNYDSNNGWVVIKNTAIVKGSGTVDTNDDNGSETDTENQELKLVKTVGTNENGIISYKLTVTNNSNTVKENLEVIDENVDNIAEITGKNAIGEILTATVPEAYRDNELSYEWVRTKANNEEEVIENNNQSTYTITSNDVNCSIGVTIKVKNSDNISTLYTVKTENIKNTGNAKDIITYKNEIKALIKRIEPGNSVDIFLNHTITENDEETGNVVNIATLAEKIVSTDETGAEIITEKTYTSNETSTDVELMKLVKTVEANENGVITYKVNVTNNSGSTRNNVEVSVDDDIDNLAELNAIGNTLTATVPDAYASNITSYEWFRVKTDSEGMEYEETIENNNQSSYEINSNDINSSIGVTIKVKNNDNYSTLYTVQTDTIKTESVENIQIYKINAIIMINEIGAGNSVDVYYQHTTTNSDNNTGNETNQDNNEGTNQENNEVILDENDIQLGEKDVVVRLKISNKNCKGNLKIIKKDSDTGSNLAGAKFKVKREEKDEQGNITSEKWINLIEGKYTYVSSLDNATEFTTDSNGVSDLKGIEAGTYKIYETAAPEGYKLEMQDGYDSSKNWIDFNRDIVVEENQTKTTEVSISNFQSGTITVTKTDGDKKLVAGFKIYSVDNKGWLSGKSRNEYKYDNTYENAPIYYNEKEANYILSLDKVRTGTYRIYEVKAPDGYILELQDGYDTTNKWVYVGEGTVTSGKTLEFRKTNLKYESISGYVWIEGIPDKGSEKDYDSIYNAVDKRVGKDEVIVKLMKKGETTPIATTGVNENGEYLFEGLAKKSEIDSYYVEFDYSSKYKDYIPVEFNKAKTNGSKALMNNVAEEDKNLTGIATTYSGTNASNISKYGIDAVGDYKEEDENGNKINEYQNINLGLKKIIKPQISIKENIANLKLNLKGYTYTYIYGGKKEKDNFEGPLVSWQNSNNKYAYSQPMYPSDVIYDKQSSKQELEVLVTYRIDITNESNYNIPELYVENNLMIENIVNEFDNKRYTLSDDNWNNTDSNKTTIKGTYFDSLFKDGIASQKTKTAYIQFKVKKDAVSKILENPNGIIEDNPTKATVIGYHNYLRDDYMWENLTKSEQGIDGVKSTKNAHKTDSIQQESSAPYLIFKLTDGLKQRIVSGTVFKDEIITTNGEILGDGKYNNEEKGVEGVKVELLDIGGENLTLSHLYQAIKNNDTGKVETKIVDAVVTTNDKGEYSLEGVVPGRYYLRFTYGNGTYKITNLNGETIQNGKLETKIDGTEINARNYKSTIINSDIVKNALEYKEDTSSMTEEQKQAYEQQLIEKIYTWYKEEEFIKDNYSVAKDNLELRKQLNASTENMNMNAQSPQISVTIENTASNEIEEKLDTANRYTTATNSSGEITTINKILNIVNEKANYQFKGLNFGIIEMPKLNAEIEKLITNIKLANAQGNVLYNGNPETVSTQGAGVVTVTDLDNKENKGSSYVRAEMVEESLYGANLELTYEVRITNTSDINYYNEEYYIYGTKDNKDYKEISLTPTTVKDYLDQTLKYDAENEKTDKDRIEEVDSNKLETITVEENDIKVQEFNLKGWKELYTNKITNRDEGHPSTDKITLVANRILSREDKDMEIVSRAEIKTIEQSAYEGEQFELAPKEVHTNGMEKATFSITPPTGENRSIVTIYAIAGIVSLLILSTGIVVIKKKIQ